MSDFESVPTGTTAELKRLTAIEIAVRDLEPYFDELICYESTLSEYTSNQLIKNVKKALDNE